jgi:hypothetical protein
MAFLASVTIRSIWTSLCFLVTVGIGLKAEQLCYLGYLAMIWFDWILKFCDSTDEIDLPRDLTADCFF